MVQSCRLSLGLSLSLSLSSLSLSSGSSVCLCLVFSSLATIEGGRVAILFYFLSTLQNLLVCVMFLHSRCCCCCAAIFKFGKKILWLCEQPAAALSILLSKPAAASIWDFLDSVFARP